MTAEIDPYCEKLGRRTLVNEVYIVFLEYRNINFYSGLLYYWVFEDV